MTNDEYKGVMVFAEQEESVIHPVTYELLGKGRDLADLLKENLSAVILGDKIEEKARELIYRGADIVYLIQDRTLREFDTIRYRENLVHLLEKVRPKIFLVGATRVGRTLAPRIAAALRTGLTADCTDLDLDKNGNLIQVRPAFSGNIMARIHTVTKPQIATVRYKVMKRAERNADRAGKIVKVKPIIVKDSGIIITEKNTKKGVDITEAELIVSCGRGVVRPDDIQMFKKLASLLGGTLGSSRPLVDMGWIGREHQVGFSGNIVKPKIYLACGISGSPQHLFGMRDSDIIVAVNKDPSAPIFSFADYGFVGDIYEIIPLLIRRIEKWVKTKGEN